MELRLLRHPYRVGKPTLGSLNIDGVGFECWTLEPSREALFPCIPAGHYEIEIRMSPTRGYLVPWLLDVPGRADIQIHIGNYADDLRGDDTDGCIVVGQVIGDDAVLRSKAAFADLMVKLEAAFTAAERVFVTITESSR